MAVSDIFSHTITLSPKCFSIMHPKEFLKTICFSLLDLGKLRVMYVYDDCLDGISQALYASIKLFRYIVYFQVILYGAKAWTWLFFGTVSHVTLIVKVLKCGLSKWMVRWIENRMNGGFQRVIFSGTGSSWRPVSSTLSHLDEEIDAISAGHWWRRAGSSGQYPREPCSPSEGPQLSGDMGREQLSEIWHEQMQGPALGRNTPRH